MSGTEEARRASTLVSVQYLRAAAAVLVVYFHIFSNRVAVNWSGGRNFGLSGVDVFFLISGFIMWTTAGRGQGGTIPFLKRRAIRVYPLWWMALTLWLIIRFVMPDRLHNADVTPAAAICSYLLIPHVHAVFAGRIWPILVPGWTLQIEMFFYCVFALALLVADRRRRLAAVVGVLCALVLAGAAAAPAGALLRTYTNPLLLEFACGALLAAGLGRLQRLPAALALLSIAMGAGLLAINDASIADDGFARLPTLGVPALLIVAGALALEPRLARRPSRLLLLLGDSSYSLYLTHPIAVSAVAVAWERLRLPSGHGTSTLLFVPVALIAALTFAVLVYRHVERPLLDRLRPARRDADGAPPAVTAPAPAAAASGA